MWCQYPISCGGSQPTHTSIGHHSTLAASFGSGSFGVTARFLWVLVHARFCLCPARLESLFPPVFWKSYNQILLAFTVRFPGDSQSLCQAPRLGSQMWGFQASQQCENFFGIIVLQFVSYPSGGYGIWFCHDCAPPTIFLRLLLCLWIWDIFFFLVGSSLLGRKNMTNLDSILKNRDINLLTKSI